MLPIVLLTLLAQEPPPLVLKSTTRLVQVNVIATRGDKPVTTLTQDDFTLTDNGKPQPITLFTTESTQSVTSTTTKAAPLPPNTFSNRLEQKSAVRTGITILLVDGLNTPLISTAFARSEVLDYLKTIRPEDHIGVYFLGNELHILHDYSNDPSDIVQKVKAFKYTDRLRAPGEESPAQAAARYRATLNIITFIAQHLTGLPARKNLVWISAGFPPVLGLTGTRGNYTSLSREMDICVHAMNNANLAIYPIDARGLTTPGRSEASLNGFGTVSKEWSPTVRQISVTNRDTMVDLAEGTGGRAWFNTSEFARAIQASIDDASFTYTLGYYPADSKGDGKYHTIKLKLNQPGVALRYRKGYLDLPEPSQSETTRKADLHNTVNSPLEATEISLVTQVKQDPTTPENLEVLIRVDPRGITLTPENNTWNGALDVLFVQKDPAGKQYNGREDTLDLHLTKDRYNSVAHNGLAYRQRVVRAPLATELRVVVRDARTGATGSLTIPYNRLKD